MITKLKLYFTAALALFGAVMSALFYRSEAKRQKARAKASEAVRQAQGRASAATIKGMDRERKAVKIAKKRASKRRDHFSK